MDQELLVEQEINAGAKFLVEFGKFAPVKIAYWSQDSENTPWYLHVASERIDDTNRRAAYGEVNRIGRQLQDPHLDPFRVKLTGADDPVARAVFEYQSRFPAHRLPTHYRGFDLAHVGINEAYIYPLQLAVSVP
jgi:hypothetical protein